MVRILIADDHQIIREGVRASLDTDADLTVVGEAETGEEALTLAQKLRPDIFLVDVTMPGRNGVDLTREWVASGGRGKVIILSMHTERNWVVDAFRAGAKGYVVKTAGPAQLIEAIKAVHRGRSYVSPAVADVLLDEMMGGDDSSAAVSLTPRERQVLQLLSEGLNAKEVAAELGISDKTVHAFRAQVMRKLDLHSMAELTKYAIRHGLTTL